MKNRDKDQVDQLVDYIMGNCLWQFHSRTWDRREQNENILKKTKQILCGENVELETPADRCYWVDAACLAETFKNNYDWINDLSHEEIAQTISELHKRIDYLTIDGSLNLELTDQHY